MIGIEKNPVWGRGMGDPPFGEVAAERDLPPSPCAWEMGTLLSDKEVQQISNAIFNRDVVRRHEK